MKKKECKMHRNCHTFSNIGEAISFCLSHITNCELEFSNKGYIAYDRNGLEYSFEDIKEIKEIKEINDIFEIQTHYPAFKTIIYKSKDYTVLVYYTYNDGLRISFRDSFFEKGNYEFSICLAHIDNFKIKTKRTKKFEDREKHIVLFKELIKNGIIKQ